jgi:hypothetical protein
VTAETAPRLFDEIVSLGQRCGITKHLRRYYGTSKSFPFDWWIISPDGAARFLRDWDAEALYDPKRLSLALQPERRLFIKNRTYGVTFAHEFPLNRFNWVLPGWRKTSAEPKARTTYLMERFEALGRPGRRVLFVRHLTKAESRRPELCIALREAVLARVGACQAEFLLISPDGVQAPGWISLATHDHMRHWAGDADLWDAALDTLGFTLKRPRDELGEKMWRKAQKRAKGRRQAHPQP